MTGKAGQNIAAFQEAAADLRHRGWLVISPHELDEDEGLDPTRDLSEEDYKHVLLRDLGEVSRVDAVIVLPGYDDSPGARAEVAFARAIGVEVLTYPDLVDAARPKWLTDRGPGIERIQLRHPVSQRFHDILHELGALHDRKAKDYGRDEDPLANVRASEDFGVPAWTGALIRLNDKVRRLQTFAAKGELANESAIDSMLDIAVYAVIARILYEAD